MQITTHTDYALRLLILLALHRSDDRPVTVPEAARRYGVSANHMAKVAQTLVHQGWADSSRGRGGGLSLAVAPDQLGLGEVMRATENLRLLECFGPDSTCPIDGYCRLADVLRRGRDAFLEVLDGYTLADIVTNRDDLLRLLDIDAASG